MKMASYKMAPVVLVLMCVCVSHGYNLNEQDTAAAIHAQNARDPKFFSLFTLVRFDNEMCNGTDGEMGVCYHSKECTKTKNGTVSGTCANGYGVCCILDTNECGESITEKVVTWTNPEYPSHESRPLPACMLNLEIADPDCCQVRLDFLDFELDEPVVNPDTNEMKCDPQGDKFFVTANGMVPTGVENGICGYNTGQHMYLNFDPADYPIKLAMFMQTNGIEPDLWRIKVTQIDCTKDLDIKAPPDCLQYHLSPSGSIKNFGFEDETSRYPPDMKYRICIERDPNTMCIRYTSNTFDLDDQAAVDPDTGIPIPCALDKDFLIVPNTDNINEVRCRDEFGPGDATELSDTAAGPYVLQFMSDAFSIDPTDPLSGQDGPGFDIDYEQFSDANCNNPIL